MFLEFGEKGGKRFFASEKLQDQKSAISFPELNARNLHKREIKLNEEFAESVTLVLVWLRAIGQTMCDKYKEPFLERFQLHPQIKYYEVNVVDGIFFKLMKPFIENTLRQQIAPEKQDRFLCYYGKIDALKNTFIENVIVGHAFLVDGMGRVRWKAHGRPTEEEIEFMINCTEELLKENQKNLRIKYDNI
ncbi:hypothetical protein QZH41_010359 [Actinostola sp. cb2023]|nr:hypothetical protein QZH41_010359 [Actinostola sp. cb2023]